MFGFRPEPGPGAELAGDGRLGHATSAPKGRWRATSRDLALLLDVQAGYDARVPLSLATEPSFAARLEASVDERTPALRIGWLGDLDGHLAMEDGILDVCAAGLVPPRGARAAASSRPRSASRPSGSGTPG